MWFIQEDIIIKNIQGFLCGISRTFSIQNESEIATCILNFGKTKHNHNQTGCGVELSGPEEESKITSGDMISR